MNLSLMSRMLALAMIWGGSFLFMRLAVPEFGAGFTAAGRLGLSALALVIFAWLQGLSLEWRKHWKAYLWIGAASAAIPFLMFALMARYLPAGYSALLNATVPLFAVLMAWGTQHARPSWSKLAGVATGMAGVITVARFGTVTLDVPTVLAFGAGLLAAFLYAFSAGELRRRFAGTDPVVAATGTQLGAAILMVPMLFINLPTAVPALVPGLALIALGLVCTATAYVMYFRVLREAGAERGTTVTFMVPLFAQLWGALFLDEAITWASLIGLALVLFAVALVFEKVRWPRRREAVVAAALPLATCVAKK
ncbi:DMT family transporter [Tahibacter amnicola]|uniref:DMT family transporter n=1 Tax=Tahibacter amnicola TaxID=2976241 RepID=A0ABY6BCZ2_9GAMM|nr:DMT family transporter [Tahibacter amnicola]UXI67441.1 DMT family transporter [Tahibacter amnicola]